MKKQLLTLLWIVIALTSSAQSNLDSILHDFHHRPDRVLVAAHRAAHPDYPENAIAAIEAAIANGVDIVELDVRETRDGVLILMHDKTVDRTTNGKGLVSKLTFAEIQQLQLVHNGKLTEHKVPTFKDALQAVKGRIMMDIDYKAEGKRAAKSTTKLLRKMKIEKQCLFFLYDYKAAEALLKMNKRLQFLCRAYNQADVEGILAAGYPTPAIHADDKFYSDSLMQVIRQSGKRLWLNSLNKYDKAELQQPGSGFDQLLQLKHTNIIQTDLPTELLLYLRSRNLHR